MRWHGGLAVGVVTAVLGALVWTAPTAQAAITDQVVSTPDFTVSYSLADVAFDGPGCVNVLLTNTYTKTSAQPMLTSARLALRANQEGASNAIGVTLETSIGSPVSDTNNHGSLEVCPSKVDLDRGPLFVSGTLASTVIGGARQEAPVPLGQISLLPNPTTLSRPKVKVTGQYVKSVVVTGSATVETLTKGVVPAGGVLMLQARKPGSGKWVSGVTARTDSYGDYDFTLSPTGKYPVGTKFRVSLSDCGWCANAVSAVSVRK